MMSLKNIVLIIIVGLLGSYVAYWDFMFITTSQDVRNNVWLTLTSGYFNGTVFVIYWLPIIVNILFIILAVAWVITKIKRKNSKNPTLTIKGLYSSMLLLLIYQVSKMVTKYILAHYSIRDGEIEYGDKALYEVHVAESTTQEALDLAVIKQLAEENFGEENEDWEYNAKEQYVEGIHGEYRILESNGGDEIPKEHFDVLKIYLGSDIIEVA